MGEAGPRFPRRSRWNGQTRVVLADSTTCKAHRSASGAAHSSPEAESLGRSRGGICAKIHTCTDRFGLILRLIDSPGHHSDLRYVRPLLAGIPATDAPPAPGSVSYQT